MEDGEGEAHRVLLLRGVDGQQQCRCHRAPVSVSRGTCGENRVQTASEIAEEPEVTAAAAPRVDHVGGGVGERQREVAEGFGEFGGVLVEEVGAAGAFHSFAQVGGGLGGGVGADVDERAIAAGAGGAPVAGRSDDSPTGASTGGRPEALRGVLSGVVENDQPAAVRGREPCQELLRVLLGRTAESWDPNRRSGTGVDMRHVAGVGGIDPQHQTRARIDGRTRVVSGELRLADAAAARQHLAQHDRPVLLPGRVDRLPQLVPGLERTRPGRDPADHHRPLRVRRSRRQVDRQFLRLEGVAVDRAVVDAVPDLPALLSLHLCRPHHPVCRMASIMELRDSSAALPYRPST